jgi:GxxExxY protein
MNKNKLIYKDLSYQIIGVLFEVSNELGYGYQEKYFEKAIADGLKLRRINYKKQIIYKIVFQGKTIGYYRLDFLIDNKIILEIKTGKRFSKKDFDQVKGYLKATGKKLAIMAIFTYNGVKFYRVLNLNNQIEQKATELNTIKIRKFLNL